MTSLTLADLLAPMSVDRFLNDYWGRKPWVQRRATANLYASLPDSDEFDFLLHSLTNPQGGWFSLVKEMARPPSEDLLTQEGLLNLSEVYGAYRAGNSLLMNQVQRRHRATGLLCRDLEIALTDRGVALSRHIGANAYLSPPHSQGFSIHYDPHDVFILQLEGRKHWRLYGRHVAHPTQPPPAPIAPEHAGKPKQEFVLNPGDLIYIPRGYLHDAQTTDSRSLHLTLSVETLTWQDLLGELMAEDKQFRRDLPSGFADRGVVTADIRQDIGELADTLSDQRKLKRALGKVAARLLANLDPLPNGGFRHVDKMNEIRADTYLRLARGGFGQVEVTGESAVLHLPGTALRTDRIMAPVFRYLLRHPRVRACDLPIDMDIEHKLNFVRELVQGGHLVPIETEPDSERTEH